METLKGITKEKVQRYIFKINCNKCGKLIRGTSHKQLMHNYEMHLLFCGKVQEIKR